MTIPDVECIWPNDGDLPDDEPSGVDLQVVAEDDTMVIGIIHPANGATILEIAFDVDTAKNLADRLMVFVRGQTPSPVDVAKAKGGDG